MDRTIIALLGRRGSGKSTAAKFLRERYNGTVVSFASPLKRLAKRLIDFSDAQLYGDQAAKDEIDSRYGFSSREFMKRLGEGARQELWPTVWADAALRFIRDLSDDMVQEHNVFIIDDCRYQNEVWTLRRFQKETRFDVIIVKLVNTSLANDDDHPSEREVDEIPDSWLDGVIMMEGCAPRDAPREERDARFAEAFTERWEKLQQLVL